ncbi:MAG: hypothetical protein ACUVQ8_07015 [Nitrososphaeria archaeon]
MSEHKETATFIKKVSTEYEELHAILRKSGSTIDAASVEPKIRSLTQPKNAGKKITALGIALIAFPDPTISDLIGSAMVVSGQYIQRKSSIGLKDTYKEFDKINSELRKAHLLC